MARAKKVLKPALLFIGLYFLIVYLFWGILPCRDDLYVPKQTVQRFMELILDARSKNDDGFLHIVASSEAIIDLYELSDLPDIRFTIQFKDFLESEYNYRIVFEELGYFDVYLEHGRWLECRDEEFTDEEVINHFKLLRVGSFYE